LVDNIKTFEEFKCDHHATKTLILVSRILYKVNMEG